jgi:hypothetical protein
MQRYLPAGRRRRTRPTAAITALLLLAGCQRTGTASPEVSLTTAIQSWQAAGLSNYTYIGRVSCFCIPDYTRPSRVTVRGGRVVAVVDVETGAPRPLETRQTIDSLFAFVQRESDRQPARLRVVFDPQLGYPREITYGEPERDAGGTIFTDSLRPQP